MPAITQPPTNGIAKIPRQTEIHRENYAPHLIVALAGGLVLAGVRYWFIRRRDRQVRLRKAKDEFLTVLGRLEAKLQQGGSHIDSWTELFHRESITPLKDAVFTIRAYLSTSSAQRILDLWHRYEQEQADAKSALIARTSQELRHGAQSSAMPAYPDDMLRAYMQQFREEVTNAV